MKAKNVEDIYPLSPMQQGMLFHTLYAPQSGFYCEQLGVTFKAPFETGMFKKSWECVIERHTILRTAFLWKGLEEPLQVVRQQARVVWEEHDLREYSATEQEQWLNAFRQTDRARGFELSRAPLMRLTLVRLSPDAYHFHWTYHHLLLDGWSTALLLDEVFTIYKAMQHGYAPALLPPRPYRDYIAWLQKQDLAETEAFWRQRMAGFTSQTPLPGDQSPGAEQPVGEGEHYAELEICLSQEATTALSHVASQHQLTLNTLVQGAWAVLLSRYSGE